MFDVLSRRWEVSDNLAVGRVSAIVCMMLPLAKDGGCSRVLDGNLRRCADLYRRGISDRVVFSNSFVIRGENETLVAKKRLIKYGVSASSIVVSKNPYNPRFRNTFEEAHFAVRIVRFSSVEAPKSLLIVANHLHMRRVLAAFRVLTPSDIKMHWVSVKGRDMYGSDAAQRRYLHPVMMLAYELLAYVYSKIKGWA